MLTLKIGMFPGVLNEYVIESGTTVRKALEMANITVGKEQEVKLDGEAIEMDSPITSGNMLLVAKRIKGAC